MLTSVACTTQRLWPCTGMDRALPNKIGDIELHVGDTLLLQVGPNFSRAYRNNPDFYLISDVEDSRPIRLIAPGLPPSSSSP